MALRIGMDIGSDTVKTVIVKENGSVESLPILSVQGQPLRRAKEALEQALSSGIDEDVILGITGSGSTGLCALLEVEPVDEPNALVAAIDHLYPDVRTIVEMGRETQKYLLFHRDEVSGRLLLEDSNLGNKCAAGSGSFLDHMFKRLNFSSIQEFAQVALEEENPAALSGRCSVFTESDIVHLYQKGTTRERIAAGIHLAISRNYRSCFAKGKLMKDKVAFIGGVAENPAVIKYLSNELGLNGNLFIPEHKRDLGSVGAALRGSKMVNLDRALELLQAKIDSPLDYNSAQPLRMEIAEIMSPPPEEDLPRNIAVAALGVDIGSVSTKAALITEIDGKCRVLAHYYRRTDGDPLAAVRDTLGKIKEQVDAKGIEIGEIFAATTGSGRYLTADYLGADLVKNEITTQANGTLAFVHADSILEIGGQDSKFIRLDGEVITDFEMNKACAAGTGAFLEKQASRLGIPLEHFGDMALKGTRPPDLDWTCTVFSESAMVYFQQNNVPIEDLAAAMCLASVKNYLHKNVGSRDIGNIVAFQGAVAFNKGMIAAYETLLGRKIVVPPYNHLTGAIGAARIAFRQRPAKSGFRGFEKVAEGKYFIKSFECRACDNRCDVNTFEMEDGPKYFYNDRCEKYSGVQKKSLAEGLPDLFEERERMMFEVYKKKAPAGAKRVGIPRGLMFCEYFPLYNAFFTELGFEVVPSDRTNKQIIQKGLEVAIGEPCFPYKVAHGHYVDVLEKGVDILFAPGVLNTEQPNTNLGQSQTCPYLQAAPEVIGTSVGVEEKGVKYLRPRLYFKRGKRHLEKVFSEVARQLGKSPAEAKAALEVGLRALKDFRDWQEKRGQEILDGLKPDQTAFVIVGRPYTLYDAINMDIGKKVHDLGVLAIPQDFIPLDRPDISDSWPNAYSRQIQKKLASARVVREDPRLRAVVLTYFACGPDSFANPFFKDEIGEPCYIMQIDEHTADAGVITRLEAFADTAIVEKKVENFEVISTDERSITDLTGRKLWIPYACESARVLSASLQAYGINAEPLPRSTDIGLNHARAVISEDVCLPALMTTEDMLIRIEQPDFDSTKEAFFQGNSEGPCRFGMYSQLQRRILDKLGLRHVDMVTLGAKSEHGGLGTHFALVTWDGLVTNDLLYKMVLRTRPYEVHPGETDALYERYLRQVCEMMPEHKRQVQDGFGKWKSMLGTGHLGDFVDLLRQAQKDFDAVPRRNEPKPLVGVVGEFYVRLHDGANQHIIRKIEKAGGEAWLAPLTEFFSYANLIGLVLSKERWSDDREKEELKELFARWLNDHLALRDEHKLYHAALPFLKGYEDINCHEVIEKGERYVHHSFGGEAICSMGKSEDFAERGIAGIVSVIPFNCMPGNTVTALSQALRKRHNNIPFLNLDYDGFVDSSRDAKITSFMWQVKERFYGRKQAGALAGPASDRPGYRSRARVSRA